MGRRVPWKLNDDTFRLKSYKSKGELDVFRKRAKMIPQALPNLLPILQPYLEPGSQFPRFVTPCFNKFIEILYVTPSVLEYVNHLLTVG